MVGGFLAKGVNVDIWWQVLAVQVVVAAVLVLLINLLIQNSTQKHSAAR